MRWFVLALVVTGCAAREAEAPVRGDLSAAIETWDDTAGADTAGSRTVRVEASGGAPGLERPVRIGGSGQEATRRRGRPVDVRFHRAPLSSALRLLAEAADLSIVIGEGLDREISVDLRRVDPIEAMRALAEAHEVELSVIGRTVVARAR